MTGTFGEPARRSVTLRVLWVVPLLGGTWGAVAAAHQAWWVGGEAAWYPVWVALGVVVALVATIAAGPDRPLLVVALPIVAFAGLPSILPWWIGFPLVLVSYGIARLVLWKTGWANAAITFSSTRG